MPVSRPLSVLIVEDHPDVAESLAELLTLHGHVVRTAGTAEAAVKIGSTFTTDVVILDARLPDEDGYAVARKLCEVLEPRPLLVMLTSYPDLEERSRTEGFDHHFLKPVHPCVLAEILRAHATRPATGAECFRAASGES